MLRLLLLAEDMRVIHELGQGYLLTVIPAIILAIYSELCYLNMYYPVFLLCIVRLLSEKEWKSLRSTGALFFMALVLSKIWLPIRVPEYSEVLGKFPEQLLFMSQGHRVITST